MVRFYTSILLICSVYVCKAQTIIAVQDFEPVPLSPVWNFVSTGGTVSSLNTGTPLNSRIRNGASSFQSSNISSTLTFEAINTSSFNDVKLTIHISSISGTASNGADAADHVRIFTALNGNSFLSNTETNADVAINGNTNSRWSYAATGPVGNAGTNTVVTGAAGTNQGTVHSTVTISIPNGTNTVGLRINMMNNDANEIWCLDDIEITGTPGGGSSITVQSSVSLFSSVTGVPSSQQSYSVSGTGLSGNINIVAPTGFEISTTNGSGYTNSLSLAHSAGNVPVTSIYIRMNSNNAGVITGTISHSSGAFIQNLSLNGLNLAIEPTIASTISFSNVLANSMTIHLSGGNGSKRIVVMSSANNIVSLPADGTVYTANNLFGSGSTIGAGEYVVFNGSSNSALITGLNPGTNYQLSVFEYNDADISTAVNYLSLAGTANQATVAAPEGMQIAIADHEYKINFDSTIAGVSNGQYMGTGFTPNPVEGQLNSNAWAITGWTDGALIFGETRSTPSSDYTRGISGGGVSTGGLYSFRPMVGNASLGFQPGGNDWAPGSITLKIQNQTGSIIHSLAVAYKLFVRNDQGRSSTFNFSWSNDHITYNDVAALNLTSVADADITPSWQQNNKSTMINGLAVLPGGYFYLRWSGNDAGGSGTRDEFALDDITISANPLSPIILPVKFADLKAMVKESSIAIEWTNLTESEVKTYIIERSEKGSHFTRIGEQQAILNDGNESKYSFIDHNPIKGMNQYRIRSVEFNESENLSPVIKVNLKNSSNTLIISPNPVTDNSINIQLNKLPSGNYNLSIYSINGQIMSKRSIKHYGGGLYLNFDLLKYPPGIYFLSLEGLTEIKTSFIKN